MLLSSAVLESEFFFLLKFFCVDVIWGLEKMNGIHIDFNVNTSEI